MTRHDDAISSLMNEWSQQQGYKTSDSSANKKARKTKQAALQRDRNLLDEIDGYPNNSFLAGSRSIWNPYVRGLYGFGDSPSDGGADFSTVISTNPHVEVIRRRCFETFKKDSLESIERILQPWKVKIAIPSVLEKWHMDAKHEERQRYEKVNMERFPIMASSEQINAWTRKDFQNYFDPILLSKQSANEIAPHLKEEVIRAWKQLHKDSKSDSPPKLMKKINQVQKALVHMIMKSRESFASQLQQAANQSLMKASSSTKTKLPKIEQVESLVHVVYAGNTFKIHAAYCEKLQRLFERQGKRHGSTDTYSFQEALFCMLCRYDTLQGAGLQAGVPGSIMDVLLDKLDCRMECFASPLNCRYETFASAFELDILFGSQASFFHLSNLPSGCYQANPPFCEGVIGALSTKLQSFLTATAEPLMFAVFVPAWKESQSYQKLLNHSFLVKHIILDQGNHWYAEGTQHRRQGSFRPASFDTSIFLYQNDAAKDKWLVDMTLVDELVNAFCQDPGIMDKMATTSAAATASGVVGEHKQTGMIKEKFFSKKSDNGQKKNKRGKKRNFFNHEEENTAHMGILASLGLAVDAGDVEDRRSKESTSVTMEKVTDFSSKNSRKKRKKKR